VSHRRRCPTTWKYLALGSTARATPDRNVAPASAPAAPAKKARRPIIDGGMLLLANISFIGENVYTSVIAGICARIWR
jgi:hypothetical protein